MWDKDYSIKSRDKRWCPPREGDAKNEASSQGVVFISVSLPNASASSLSSLSSLNFLSFPHLSPFLSGIFSLSSSSVTSVTSSSWGALTKPPHLPLLMISFRFLILLHSLFFLSSLASPPPLLLPPLPPPLPHQAPLSNAEIGNLLPDQRGTERPFPGLTSAPYHGDALWVETEFNRRI